MRRRVAVLSVLILISSLFLLSSCNFGRLEYYYEENHYYGEETPNNERDVDVIKFGKYEQDNDTSDGKEDIEWLVVAEEDGKILVLSKYALDCQPYNTENTEVTWETSSVRKWINDYFIDAAFSKEEQEMIPTSVVTADKHSFYGTSAGNDTSDKVFLLSLKETNKYLNHHNSMNLRKCSGTEYCIAQGAEQNYLGLCVWWLRSPGQTPDRAVCITNDAVFLNGSQVDTDGYAVRPAMWLNADDWKD